MKTEQITMDKDTLAHLKRVVGHYYQDERIHHAESEQPLQHKHIYSSLETLREFVEAHMPPTSA